MTSEELLKACIKYDVQRRELRSCLEERTERNELISNYLTKIVEDAKENPYWCEAIVKANGANTGICCSESFTYLNQQGQELYLEDAFAISLVAEGLRLAEEFGLEEKLTKIKPKDEEKLFLLLPKMESILSQMGYGVEEPLYSDANGMISVEGQTPTERYETLTAVGRLSSDNRKRLEQKFSAKSKGDTGLFYVGGLFDMKPRAQPELS